jgi:signal transduction histidine kinase
MRGRSGNPRARRPARLGCCLVSQENTASRSAGAIGPVERALSRLFDAVAAVQGEPDGLERAAQLIAEEAHAQVPECEVVISIVSRDRPEHFRCIGGGGQWAQTVVGGEWRIDGTVNGRALVGEGPIELREPATQSVVAQVIESGAMRSARLIPLVAGAPLPDGRFTLGVIGFWCAQDREFTDDERGITDRLAQLASLLLLRVEAWHAAISSESRLELRRAIAENVQTSLDIVEVVNRTVDQLRRLSRADRVTLSRIEGGEIEVLASTDTDPSQRTGPRRVPLAKVMSFPMIARAVTEGRSVTGDLDDALAAETRPVAGGTEEEDEAALVPMQHGAGHFVVVPLVIRQEVTGLIALTRRTGSAFRSEEIAELEIAASVSALGLRSAGLYSQSQAALRARSAFLNLAAHELRTPFAVIAGYLSLLGEGAFGDPGPAWKRPLEILTEKSQELGSLIDQILLAARAESGRLVKSSTTIDLVEAARDAAARAASRLALYEGDVSVTGARRLAVSADPAAVATILDNLINNAITYRRDAPQLTITVEEDAAAGRGVVGVRDNGRGIPSIHQAGIFDQFQRIEVEGYSNPSGTGLGLYISRTLATDMGGALDLMWSEVGSGSEFRLGLPRVAAASPGAEKG